MADSYNYDHYVTDNAGSAHKENWISLTTVLVVGWIVYEVTHSPGAAAFALCTKFGWRDFRTALWLRYQDPIRSRGIATFWLYASSALWKIAIVGVLMTIVGAVIIGIHEDQQRAARRQQAALVLGPDGKMMKNPQAAEVEEANERRKELLGSTMLTALLAFSLCTVTSCRAAWCAWRAKVRLWLHSDVCRARELGYWPPNYGRSNKTLALFTTALIILVVVQLPVLVMILVGILHVLGAPQNGKQLFGLIAIGMALMWFTSPVFILAARSWLKTRMIAQRPADCWGDEPWTDEPQALPSEPHSSNSASRF